MSRAKELPAIGTLWKHTPKAVRAGCPADRIYAVVAHDIVNKGTKDERMMALAWKCDLFSDNIYVQHPAYMKPVKVVELMKMCVQRARNGAKPTATFTHDSFYQPYYRKE